DPAAPPIDPLDLQERMSAAADLPAVADDTAFSVVDADTGQTLAARDERTALVPASTLKLLTAAADLGRPRRAHRAGARLHPEAAHRRRGAAPVRRGRGPHHPRRGPGRGGHPRRRR